MGLRPDGRRLELDAPPVAEGRSMAFTTVERSDAPAAEDAAIIPPPDEPPATAAPVRVWSDVKRVVFGRPIPTSLEPHERLTRAKALAVFSSDALSSVAYATEEILKTLLLAGVGVFALTLPIAGSIVVLLAIVVVSYRQTIAAYPNGGGSYIVASDNLGPGAGLLAAASLMIDYVLTVAVSIAAGVLALTSLEPALDPYRVELAIGAVGLIAVANMRGVRESASIFAVPTYAFIAMMSLLIGWGMVRLATGGIVFTPPPTALPPGDRPVALFLLLSAFSQGCSAMTGTEAISNGVPAFRAPEARNARTTLLWMGVLLGAMFLGLSLLATRIPVRPADESILSQIGRAVFGPGPLWVALQCATAGILVLAANTAFADFPRLASILARDRYLPRAFQFRGDRLAFNVGILNLAALAAALLAIFHSSVDHLIPLYAVGVFTSFTLSQAGMVARWRRVAGPHWVRSAAINGVGAVATGAVTAVIAITKFTHGAWIVLVVAPALIAMMVGVRRHYASLERRRQPQTPLDAAQIAVRAVVPIADLGAESRQALAFARAIAASSEHVVAVHVTDDADQAHALLDAWTRCAMGARLEIVASPYRSLLGPLLGYLDAQRAEHPGDTLVVVLPEFVPAHWWEHLLHNQTALRIKLSLLFHPGVIVASVPYHLGQPAARR
jgi:amino acid transporter